MLDESLSFMLLLLLLLLLLRGLPSQLCFYASSPATLLVFIATNDNSRERDYSRVVSDDARPR